MDITSFFNKEGRTLPVILMVDTSRSMEGMKIETVNVAVKEMLSCLKNIKNPKGVIEIAILTFGNDEVKVLKKMSKIDEADYYRFEASGNTPMGKAFEAVHDMIEDYNIISSRAYTPTIILISDGNPTDFENYNDTYLEDQIKQWGAMKILHSGSRTSKTTKLAMGIGDDINLSILKAFINDNTIPVIKANENRTIQKFFKWVTRSISVRSVSVNPNNIDIDTYIFDRDEMEF